MLTITAQVEREADARLEVVVVLFRFLAEVFESG
jgi:hypothetical protein